MYHLNMDVLISPIQKTNTKLLFSVFANKYHTTSLVLFFFKEKERGFSEIIFPFLYVMYVQSY